MLVRQPAATPAGCVLVVPPFAEEMNKCRRMVTGLGLGLARQGVAMVVPDLLGTGDSDGDFADGDWDSWQGDLASVTAWSVEQGLPVTGLLAIRLGAALAAVSVEARAIVPVARSALWQPAFDGNRFLTQFLRLRTAAGLMADRKESVTDIRGRLKAGDAVEVAGYGLTGRLAASLETLVVPTGLPRGFGAVSWLEVVREQGASLPPPAARLVDETRNQGGEVEVTAFASEPYWSSTEIVVNDAIIDRTLAHFLPESAGVGR